MTGPAGWVRRFQNLAGRIWSTLEVLDISRVGSGRVKRVFKPHGSGRVTPIQPDFSVEKWSDPCKSLVFIILFSRWGLNWDMCRNGGDDGSLGHAEQAARAAEAGNVSKRQ